MPVAKTPEQLEERRIRQREYSRRWRAKNPEKVRARGLADYYKSVEHNRARGRLWHRKQAGIVDATGETRSGPCDICTTAVRTLHLDHDHATGLTRGWLCQKCNRGLGHFNDSADLLLAAGAYLERTK